VHPLVHWIELRLFLQDEKYFKVVYLIISAQVLFCTSFASFYTSWIRFSTDTANIQTVCFQFLIIAPIRSGGAAHTKQPSLIFTDKKTRVLERACIVAKKGAIGPIFEGDMPP
jgi:hypothetical protein